MLRLRRWRRRVCSRRGSFGGVARRSRRSRSRRRRRRRGRRIRRSRLRNGEQAGEIHMPCEGVRFLPVDQNFQLADSGHICAQRLRNGVHGKLFAQNSGRGSRRQLVGKISDAGSIRLNVKSQECGVRSQSSALRRRSLHDQCNQKLLGPLDRIRRERELDRRGLKRRGRGRRKPKHLRLHLHVGGRRYGDLHHLATRFLFGSRIALDSFNCLPEARERDESKHDQGGKYCNRRLESSRHGAICPPVRTRHEMQPPRGPRRQRGRGPSDPGERDPEGSRLKLPLPLPALRSCATAGPPP